MNSYSLEKFGVAISNGWIVGCSILTCGILTSAYLDGISELSLIHMKHKYNLESKEKEKSIDLSDKIKNEEQMISYYWKHMNIAFMIGITGFSFVALRTRFIKT